MQRQRASVILMAVFSALLGGVVLAQVSLGFDLSWSLLTGGGGQRQSASYLVQDALGQWAGGAASSANARIEAGYYSGVALATPTPTSSASASTSFSSRASSMQSGGATTRVMSMS